MNGDFTHVLPFGALDFPRLALAINAFAGQTGWSLAQLASCAGVTKMTVSRAARGNKVCAETVLKLCVVMDLNPFELLSPSRPVSRETTTVTRVCEHREAAE